MLREKKHTKLRQLVIKKNFNPTEIMGETRNNGNNGETRSVFFPQIMICKYVIV